MWSVTIISTFVVAVVVVVALPCGTVQRRPCTASAMVNISVKFLYPHRDPDQHTNLTSRFDLVTRPSPQKFITRRQLFWVILLSADRQTERQRQKHYIFGGCNMHHSWLSVVQMRNGTANGKRVKDKNIGRHRLIIITPLVLLHWLVLFFVLAYRPSLGLNLGLNLTQIQKKNNAGVQ